MPLFNFRPKTKGQGKHGLNLPPTNNTGEELETLLSEIEQLSTGSRNPSDISRQVMLCQTALRLVNSAVHPIPWAALQGLLAMRLHENPLGERADNLDQALFHYEQALQVYTPQAFPQQWAAMQFGLAKAYSERIRGERADNLEQAISHSEQTLQVFTPQSFPKDWAGTQTNLGNAYRERIRGERADVDG